GVIKAVVEGEEKSGNAGPAAVWMSSEILGIAFQGIVNARGDVSLASKGVMIGVMRGLRETGIEASPAVGAAAGTVIKEISEVSVDLGHAAVGAVEGAIAGAGELNMDAAEAGSSAANGALQTAAAISLGTANEVREALAGRIAGIKVILDETLVRR
ncbi:MAG TPA: hypothetical protein VE131_02555, partial [Terriglobales bacterium]|nr:hypothetical protein [Terriglobales bacterium]